MVRTLVDPLYSTDFRLGALRLHRILTVFLRRRALPGPGTASPVMALAATRDVQHGPLGSRQAPGERHEIVQPERFEEDRCTQRLDLRLGAVVDAVVAGHDCDRCVP